MRAVSFPSCCPRFYLIASSPLNVHRTSSAPFVKLIAQAEKAPSELPLSTVADGITAAFIFVAMTFGLIAPKLLIEHLLPSTDECRKTVLQRSGKVQPKS
jgi:hypothetical protein